MIIDASVAVKWFAPEDGHDHARALLTGDDPLFAPDLLAAEFANALWLKVGRGELDERNAVRAIAAVASRGEPELRPSAPLMPRAFELARRLNHPVYDCVYLALAEELDRPLVTADERLVEAAGTQTGQAVRLLGR